jgi:hypothetical protein
MSKHLEFILLASSAASLSALKNDMLKCKANDSQAKIYAAYLSGLRADVVKVNGTSLKVTRVFVAAQDSGSYAHVGWVLASEVSFCMVCASGFGMFNKKHHCRSCGHVVCHSCSNYNATIIEISSLGPMRICKQCFSGRVINF